MSQKEKKRKRVDAFQNFLFLVPTLVLLGVFVIYPFVSGLIYSFTDWNGMIMTEWVGLKNYKRLFTDLTFQDALVNTLIYGVGVTILEIPLGLVVANILNAPSLRMSGIFRTTFYLPVTVSLLVVSNVFNVILVYNGIVDRIWMLLGHETGLNVMSDMTLMKVAMIIIMLWQNFGSCVVFMLAGLQGIPADIQEAAMVDGAGSFTRFFRITLPMMSPVIMVVTFITMNGMLKTFDLPFKLTNGGPGTATVSVAMLIYNQAFSFNNASYATTTGVILLIVVSILAVLQMRVTGGKEDDT